MGVTEERARLIVEAGTVGFAETDAKIVALQAEIARLNAGFQGGTVSIDDYMNHGVHLNASLAQNQAALKAAEDAMKKYGNATAAAAALSAAATKANSNYQQRITALGYALNDFFSVSGNLSQRLNAIANNLPMLFAGFGHLGLVLSGLVPIIAMVINSWGSIKEAITGVADEWGKTVEGMKAKLAELEKKKVKVGTDFMEIEALKGHIKEAQDAIEAVNRLKTGQTKAERESGAAAAEALQETTDQTGKKIGAPQIVKALTAAKIMDFIDTDKGMIEERRKIEENEKKIADLEKQNAEMPGHGFNALIIARNEALIRTFKVRIAAAREAMMDIRTRISAAEGDAEKAVGEDIAELEKGHGPGQLAAGQRVANLAKRVGLGALAGQLEAHTPAQIREEEEARKQEDEAEKLAKMRNDASRVRGEILTAQGEKEEAQALHDAKTNEERQKIALERITNDKGIQDRAAELAERLKKQGVSDVEIYKRVWKQAYAEIQRQLARAGDKIPEGIVPTGRQVEEAAKGLAGNVPEVANRKWAEEFARLQADFEAGEKEVEDVRHAEVGRLMEAFGEKQLALFRAAIEGDKLTPPEELARQLVERMTAQFRQVGARAGAAQQAARQIAAQGGFAVGPFRMGPLPRQVLRPRNARKAAPILRAAKQKAAKAPALPVAEKARAKANPVPNRPPAPVRDLTKDQQDRKDEQDRKVAEFERQQKIRRQQAGIPGAGGPGPQAANGDQAANAVVGNQDRLAAIEGQQNALIARTIDDAKRVGQRLVAVEGQFAGLWQAVNARLPAQRNGGRG